MATNGPDLIFGTLGNDVLEGLLGNDLLFASVGQDILNGGGDYDVAIYEDPSFVSGVFINNTNVQIGSVAAYTVDKRGFGTDSLVSIEGFNASNFDDIVYVGGLGDTHSFDRAGDDVVFASQDPNATRGHVFVAGSGNDTYFGTVNRDALDLENDQFDALGSINQAAVVDLATGTATDGWGFQDTLFSIEDVWGTSFNDTLLGDDNDNEIEGQGGDDLIEGRGGNDTLFGGLGKDTIRGGDGDDFIEGDGGFDVVPGAIGDDDILEGGAGDDRIFGGDGNDTLRGGAGNDTLEGGDGDDVLDASGGSASSNNFGDWVVPGLGRNTIIGHADLFLNIGDGIDLSYADLSGVGGITLTVGANGTGTAVSGTVGLVDDTFTYAHRFRGTQDADVLVGSDNPNWEGWEGWEGNDVIDGAGGFDELLYHQENGAQGSTVNFQTGIATDTWGDTDIFSNIEAVRGSTHGDTFTGNGALQYIRYRGLDGADVITGSSGFDELDHSRDENYGGTSGITARLDLGTVVDGFGRTDTVSGIDKVKGTDFDDVMVGSAADEELEGLGGNDLLEGGDGDDRLYGGRGDDVLDGGAERPQYSGGDRASYDLEHYQGGTLGITANLILGTVTDTFGDTDTLISIEEIRGSIFNDVITGSAADERLQGQAGDDNIAGNDGNDDLSGGRGNDLLNGGVGGDFLQPGLGTDTVIGGANAPTGDDDELSYFFDSIDEGTANGISVTFTNETDGTAVDYGGSTDTFSGIERVRGTNNNDTFVGAAGNQTFLGFGGDDFFDGGAGDRDRIDYSFSDESFFGGSQGVTVKMLAGTATDAYGDTDTFTNIERIRGTGWDDDITGDDNENQLRGEDGDDILSGMGGFDDLSGGDGDDILTGGDGDDFLEPGRGTDIINGDAAGGLENFDILSYFFSARDDGAVNGVSFVFTSQSGGTVVDYAGDTDTFSGIERVRGTLNADSFVGAAGTQRFRGFAGDDFFDGGAGIEDQIDYARDRADLGAFQGATVDMGAGTAEDPYGDTDTFVNIERIRGSEFDDTIIAAAGAQGELDGHDGNDTLDMSAFSANLLINFLIDTNNIAGLRLFNFENLISGSGDDDLIGDTGRNVIDGGAGNDRIRGNDGNDSLFGGNGNDLMNGNNGDDEIEGGAGNDRAFGGEGNDTLRGGAGADTLEGQIGDDVIIGGDGNDILRGGNGNDDIEGGVGDDTAFGGNGNDTLSGGLGNDTLNGSGGMDVIVGGVGNDLLIGETGSDQLFGDAGEDVLRGGGGDDLLSGGAEDDVLFGASGEDSLFGGDGDDTLEGNAQADDLFGDAGNDILRGGDGFDLLVGGAGNDTLAGGNGNDVLIGGEGQDTLRGQANADMFVFENMTDSSFGAADLIDGIDGIGVAGGDVIDLSAIDADTGMLGNQTFSFAGALTTAQGLALGAGTLWLEDVGNQTRVYALVDSDNQIDFALRINDGATLSASDYISGDFIL